MKTREKTLTGMPLWAGATDHLLLLTAAAMMVAAAPALPLATWVAVLTVQTVIIWNMRRFVEKMPLLKKLLSTLPMILGSLLAVLFFPPQLKTGLTPGSPWLALGLGVVVLAFTVANLRRSIDFIRNPEMIAFVVPGVNYEMARAEAAYILLAPIAEELAFRHFPALVFSASGPYLVIAIGAFVTSHYINPWQGARFGVARILEQTAMAAVLTLTYLGFGLIWAVLAHVLYNFTARGFYVSYLVKRTHLA